MHHTCIAQGTCPSSNRPNRVKVLGVAVALLLLAVALLSPPARAHLTPHSRRSPDWHTHDVPTHACLPVLLAGWLHGTREEHTHRNSCHLLDTREARVSHAPHAHSCSLKEAQVRAAKPPKPPVAPAVHPLRSRDGADAAAAAAALRRSPRTCRFRCYPPLFVQKDLLQLAVSPVHVNNFFDQKS